MPNDLVYLRCPVCGRKIEEPFVRGSGPVAFVHRHRGRKNARLVVVPDPDGDDHRIFRVGGDRSIEAVLIELLEAS